jgi:hypothetical protein
VKLSQFPQLANELQKGEAGKNAQQLCCSACLGGLNAFDSLFKATYNQLQVPQRHVGPGSSGLVTWSLAFKQGWAGLELHPGTNEPLP